MSFEEIQNKILAIFREKELMQDLQVDDDFFDLGVSSLTVVELQIAVEKILNFEVSTSTLMRSPTVAEWSQLYLAGVSKD